MILHFKTCHLHHFTAATTFTSEVVFRSPPSMRVSMAIDFATLS